MKIIPKLVNTVIRDSGIWKIENNMTINGKMIITVGAILAFIS